MERYDFLLKEMGISQEQLLQTPQVFDCRLFKLQQRHGFLKSLGRAQYDAKKDLYVSLKRLYEGTDEQFSLNVAKRPVQDFYQFLKSV